jgi:hypothetical protein
MRHEWIPACAGMTENETGMMKKEQGMAGREWMRCNAFNGRSLDSLMMSFLRKAITRTGNDEKLFVIPIFFRHSRVGGNPNYDYHGFWIAALTLAIMKNCSVLSARAKNFRRKRYLRGIWVSKLYTCVMNGFPPTRE